MFFVPPRRKELRVALPMSTFTVNSGIQQLTQKIGSITRTLAIFRVTDLLLIEDVKDEGLKEVISGVTEYMTFPPYLKRSIPRKAVLRKVGVLPPLDLPLHPRRKELVEGEIRRAGLKKGKTELGVDVEIKGGDKYFIITDSLSKKAFPYRGPLPYLGFNLKFVREEWIKGVKNLIIGSRSGKDPMDDIKSLIELYEKSGITLLIGPPRGGLMRSLGGNFLSKAYNFIPNQGVANIRSEEALFSALAILNMILG